MDYSLTSWPSQALLARYHRLPTFAKEDLSDISTEPISLEEVIEKLSPPSDTFTLKVISKLDSSLCSDKLLIL